MPTDTGIPNLYAYLEKSMHVPCVCIDTYAPFLFDIRKVHYDSAKNDGTLSSFHTHDFFSIVLFTEGNGSHIIDNHRYEIEPNTLVLISPFRLHKHMDSTGLTCYAIAFSYNFLDLFDNNFKRYIICNFFGGQRKFTFHRINVEDIAKFKNLLDLAIEETNKHQYDPWQTTFIKSIVTTFFILLKKYGEILNEDKNITDNTYDETLYNFENLVERSYKSTHSVYSYAKELNMSVGTLNKHITKNTGVTALDIIDNRIISEARKLLTFSDYSIAEISLQLGFSDSSNFAKFFKRNTGITPSEFKGR